MNLAAVDWLIIAVVFILVVGSIWFTRRFMRGVADFLAAGRTAGRYLISEVVMSPQPT